jgi:dephospho-CoA kinase
MIAGLTGGICSGKSTVASIFSLLGYPVFYSDKAAHKAYFLSEVRPKIEKILGKDAYTDDKNLNKPYISERIFGTPSLREAVNSVVHPAVGLMLKEFSDQFTEKVIIKESALLFEAGLEKSCDTIIVVSAPDDLRLQRLMSRDNLTEAEARMRIESQLPQEVKIQQADHLIVNDDKMLVIPQVLAIHLVFQKICSGGTI